MSEDIHIRRMQLHDLDFLLKLTQQQGWPHRKEDLALHFRLGHGWVACLGEKQIGSIVWWAYGSGFGTLGLVMVDEKHQGMGLGSKLMEVVLDDAGPRTLQLNSTQAGLKLYQNYGFEAKGTINQHQGVPTATGDIPVPAGTVSRSFTSDDREMIRALDAEAFGADRGRLINALLNAGDACVLERDGILNGFAIAREAGRGFVIGPVVATDQMLAKALISTSLKQCSGFVRIDIDGDAVELAEWLDGINLVCIDRGVTMLRGRKPDQTGPARIFALAAQALC